MRDPDGASLDPIQMGSGFDPRQILLRARAGNSKTTQNDLRCQAFGVKLPADVLASIQNRACTCPVRYTPE